MKGNYDQLQQIRTLPRHIGGQLRQKYQRLLPRLWQRPSMSWVGVEVDPQSGNIGSVFRFYVQGFVANSEIKVKITYLDNSKCGCIIYDSVLKANKDGYGQLELQTTSEWMQGSYKFEVEGLEERVDTKARKSTNFQVRECLST